MSQHRRSHTTTAARVAAVGASGLLAGLPLLVAGPAWADAPQVEFTGGGVALACGSSPSADQVTVIAESTVVFINKLDSAATLRVDGQDAARVGKGQPVEMRFHRGPAQITMVPDCLLNLNRSFTPVAVNVVPAAGAPVASPTKTGGTSRTGHGSGSSSSSGNGITGSAGKASPDGHGQQSPSGAPMSPADGGAGPSDAGTLEGPVTAEGEQGLAAEPVVAAQATSGTGPNGLLALIATVCVVGVSAGAIRAIVAQRATRTSVA